MELNVFSSGPASQTARAVVASTISSATRHDPFDASNVNLVEKTTAPNSKLKYHYAAIWLIALYLPFVIVPWVITIILSYRPISQHTNTYYYPKGFTLEEYKQMQSWARAIKILNSIASLLAVPVVSFVIAQLAVIFSQQRESTRQLSVRDVFALADRAWTDISVLFKLMRAKGHGSRAFNNFIALASSLLLITSLQPPLYQVLVDWKNINTPSGVLGKEYFPDFPGSEIDIDDTMRLGNDAEPAAMEMIPQTTVVQNVQFELPSFRWSAPETYMWIDYNGTQPPTSKIATIQGDAINSLENIRIGKSDWPQHTLPGFVTAFPYNVTTGTRRYHAIRFNSTIECEPVLEDQFPVICPGMKPYVTSIKAQNDTSSTELRVCVPGSWGSHPWTLSRNRQDIEEEAFLQLLVGPGTKTSSTVRCSSATTRGYFELGNYRINGAYGLLLERWPSNETVERDFNDKAISCSPGDSRSNCHVYSYLPTEWDTWIGNVLGWNASKDEESDRWNASSPLVTSIMALFGNDSWIRTVANFTSKQGNTSSETAAVSLWWKSFCERQPLYRSDLAGDEYCKADREPSEVVAAWLANSFNVKHKMDQLIFSGLVLTHKAILTTHRRMDAPRQLSLNNGRQIYFSPGFYISKPDMSVSSKVIISVLIAIQVVGLLFCAAYIARVPTWTRSFNAMAIARIGAGLEKDDLPVDGQYAEDKDYERLRLVKVPLSMASANAIRRRQN